VSAVPRFGAGSRVPGWDAPADLGKEPATVPAADRVEVPEELRAEIEEHMSHYPDRRSAALPALAAAQRFHGWCSPEAMEQVACVMRVTPAYLESVASFYDMLETRPVGAHSVYVCTNISCSLRGAESLYEAFAEELAADPGFNLRRFECLGACDIAPMASVDGVYVGPLSAGDVGALLDDVREGRPPLPQRQLARRLVADPHANTREFAEHPAQHLARPGAATPQIDAERTLHGGPAGGDRPGPSAPLEDEPRLEEDSS
jgi:NADH-quinone oxidoreductase subunit E